MPHIENDDSEDDFEPHFETLQFQIATNVHRYGRKCLQFSRYYCLVLWLTSETRARIPRRNDRNHFWNLTVRNYTRYNWFSFHERDAGRCCIFQTMVYTREGMENGFSPFEETVFNYLLPDKKNPIFHLIARNY